jgi:AbrB family looped-hinge helix DNA binding protein
MSSFSPSDFEGYGLTTVGERGQIVIPKGIRSAMKVKTGDKFFVFSHANKMVVMIKPKNFNLLINEMTKVLKKIKKFKK